MEEKILLEKLLDLQIDYKKKMVTIEEFLDSEPVVLSMINSLESEVDKLQDFILDALDIPKDEENKSKYRSEPYLRSVCRGLMNQAIQDPDQYRDPTIEIIMDRENLSDYVKKVETHGWFYYQALLDEYIDPKEEAPTEKEKQTS